MAIPLVILGLMDKRARLVAEVEHHSKIVAKAQKGIETIDAALALWDEGLNAPKVRRRYRHDPGPFKRKELGNMVVDALRASGDPLTTRQLSEIIAEAKGINLADPKEKNLMYRRVGWTIQNKLEIGVIEQAGTIGERCLWGLVSR